ncbi:MAG: gamma-glutamyltransferase [Nitrospiraceae bacterium]|nr:MAG: gamma-glutamyltransferase [Nitrospiraceae bacterium]
MTGAVAAGHPLTSGAAAEMLSLGGNAFDAAVSAGFASVAAEPALTSLGGGGFLLAHIREQNEDILFDFFVDAPGLNADRDIKPVMTPVDIKFPGHTQVFHTGFASAAVPGMLKGLLHVHKRLCRLPLATVVAPAISCLEKGVEVCETQGTILSMLEPVFTSTEYGRSIFIKNGRYIRQGDRLFNPLMKESLQGIAQGSFDLYQGETARMFIEEINNHHGTMTLDDLRAYKVMERKPVRFRYRNREVITNPAPSTGGILLALALGLLEQTDLPSMPRDSAHVVITLIEAMKEIASFNPLKNSAPPGFPFAGPVMAGLIESFRKNTAEKTFTATLGTTHISIIDSDGNAASMTTSNGSGSGCFMPGTGIMLNNMMGEDDLHPEGFFSSPSGQRVSSMMMPAMVMKDGSVESVLGSGGSKRIKTAMLQVLINLIDFHLPVKDAVERARVHYEDGVVHTEPGIEEDVIGGLRKVYPVNPWRQKNMYFGGVNCVSSTMQGMGDRRRGGSFLAVR